MNKKKFNKELNKLIVNRFVTPFYIEQFFRSKKSLFNDERVDVLIQNNFAKVLSGFPKGSADVSINNLYEHPEMKSFMEREDTVKMILDSVDHFDFKSVIRDSAIRDFTSDFINNNFDYVSSNYDLKKMVAIFEHVDLTKENKEKMHEYYLAHKEEFLKEILTTTLSIRGNLSEKESDALIKIVSSIVDKTMVHENATVMDIKTLLAGSFSSVIRVGDTIIKVGTPRKTFDMPNDKRILQPHLRRDLQSDLGIAAVIEVADRVDTDFSISHEEMYQVYKDMRDRGIVCGDFKYGNLGKLIKDNPPRGNEKHGLHGAVTETLKSGEYVLIDTDFVYKEGDPKIELSSDMSIQFEKRYKREKAVEKPHEEVRVETKEVKIAPVKKGR